MGEEKPTNTSNAEEHIYLDVIHIASRPPSKRSLCPTADDSLQTPDAQDVTKMENTRKKSGNFASWVLIVVVIFLSALCCTLGGLYAIERRRAAMLEHENSKRSTTPKLFTNCTTVRSVPKPNDLDCVAIESGIKKAKALYSKKCVKRMSNVEGGRSQDHSINNTPTECVKKSLQFSSISDMITSQSGMAMASATVCFWCKKSPGVTHYIKYKEPNKGKGFEFFEERSVQSSQASASWHSFCWTWSTDEEFNRSYKDGRLVTHKEINRETRMPGGGTWELGLRSDTRSGVKARRYGEITSVNVWNRILRKNELTEIMTNCMSKYQGNVKSWQEFKTAAQGNVKLVKSGCCET